MSCLAAHVSGTSRILRRRLRGNANYQIDSISTLKMKAPITPTFAFVLLGRMASGFSASPPSQAKSSIGMPPFSEISEHLPLARKAMSYLDSSPDPFHAVKTSVDLLEETGFTELLEGAPYNGKVVPGGKYYFTKNKSTLVAFTVGSSYQPGNGFKIIGGHNDSPNLKIKPRSKRSSAGCIQLAVECCE